MSFDLTLTPQVLATFTDKDSKEPRYRSLYEHHDFLSAYARHTDLRVAADPKGAIGRNDEWESHGEMQLAFLKEEGLKPSHRLLEVGCGVGRAARRLVPYLDVGNYTGVDISQACLEHTRLLSITEGWTVRQPMLLLNADLDIYFVVEPYFDFAWAHSVFTHLPDRQIEVMIGNAAKALRPGGRFLFTYKHADQPRRSGLKQFQYPFEFFAALAAAHRFEAEALPKIWPASQRTVRLTKRA